MGVWLHLEGLPPVRCVGFVNHVHAEITRDRGRSDPRVFGRSRHEDFTITRGVDHLSPRLLRWCAEGHCVDAMRLEIRKRAEPNSPPEDGAPPAPPTYEEEQPHFSFHLGEVYITGVLASLDDGPPLETVALDYGTIRWIYEGTEADHHDASWDVLRRKP